MSAKQRAEGASTPAEPHPQPAAGTGRPASLVLEGEMTIYRAAELGQTLKAALAANGAGLDIDLAAVTDIDSSGVQLLMAAKRAALAAGVPLTLQGHSAPVLDVFEHLDLAAFFGDSLIVNG
jgi:anti-sigma B factor antagonist